MFDQPGLQTKRWRPWRAPKSAAKRSTSVLLILHQAGGGGATAARVCGVERAASDAYCELQARRPCAAEADAFDAAMAQNKGLGHHLRTFDVTPCVRNRAGHAARGPPPPGALSLPALHARTPRAVKWTQSRTTSTWGACACAARGPLPRRWGHQRRAARRRSSLGRCRGGG